MKCPFLIFSAAVSVIAATGMAQAQSFSIDWYSIDGGGGTSTGAGFALDGTIGQTDAGTLSGSGFTLTGGFWSIVTAVQTVGAPALSTRLTGPSTVVVSWPLPANGFVLQQNAVLGTANWANVPTPPSDTGTTRSVTLSTSPGQWFFRLNKP